MSSLRYMYEIVIDVNEVNPITGFNNIGHLKAKLVMNDEFTRA